MEENILIGEEYNFKTYLVYSQYDFRESFIVIGAETSDEAIDIVLEKFYVDGRHSKDEYKDELCVEEHTPIILGKCDEIDRYDNDMR